MGRRVERLHCIGYRRLTVNAFPGAHLIRCFYRNLTLYFPHRPAHSHGMEWVPTVFIAFKASVLSIGMYFAIKWHYDQGRKKGTETQRAMLRMGAKLVALFLVLVAVLLVLTFKIGTWLGLDLTSW